MMLKRFIQLVESSYFTQLKMCYLRARESSVTHKSAITDHAVEENHVMDWDNAKWSTERHCDRPDG